MAVSKFKRPVTRMSLGIQNLRSAAYPVATGSSVDINLESSSSGFLFTSGVASNSRGIYSYGLNSVGEVGFSAIFAASGVSIASPGNNTVTVTNSSGAVCRILKLWTD